MGNPTNQTAEVLYELINNSPISRADVFKTTGILNVTARIADLRIRYGVNVVCDKVNTKNKFSRPISYGIWSIRSAVDLEKAREVYSQINKK